MQRRHARHGFTLIEIMLAVFIVLVIFGLAIPMMNRGQEDRLRGRFDTFNELAQKAQANAVTEQRSWVLVWDVKNGQILLQPDAPTSEERLAGGAEKAETFPFEEGEAFSIDRPARLLPKENEAGEWIFWRSGTCEPVVIKYEGPDGIWTASYHPLTGRGEIEDMVLN